MNDQRLLSDRDWEILGPLLPPERGRACRPSHDNRLRLEAMLWMARSGAPWRMLPEKYGKWNSV
ncbi:MAG: transposase, partial [Thauera sp.]|nr:transposase [Thauera sp.]